MLSRVPSALRRPLARIAQGQGEASRGGGLAALLAEMGARGIGDVYRNLGLDDAPAVSSNEAWDAVLTSRSVLHLADGLQVRRVLVMGQQRVELCDFTDGMVGRLKAMGLTSEIISWRLRLFIPTSRMSSRYSNDVLRHAQAAIAPKQPIPSQRW